MKALVPALLFGVLLVSCQTSPPALGPGGLDEEVLARMPVKFVFEEIPLSFWDKPGDDGTLFFNFFLFHGGKVFTPENLKSVRASDEAGNYWTLNPTVYPTSVGGWFRCSDTTLSLNRSVLSCQKYFLDFQTKDGQRYRKTVDLTAVLASKGGPKFIYSQDYDGKKGPDYLAALARPVVRSVRTGEAGIDLEFTVDDPRVLGFDVFLYDAKNGSLGDCPSYYNDLSGQVSVRLNGGKGFYADGRVNQLRITPGEVSLAEGRKLGDLANLIINVHDKSPLAHRGDFIEFQTKSDRYRVR